MFISSCLMFIISSVMALIAMAFFTLLERKALGYFQNRKGPNKVSISGIPQPFADALKLLIKEQTTPSLANFKSFLIAPIMALTLAILTWFLYPYSSPLFFTSLSILLFLCISSLNVYATLMAGWSSNSKYALLGALRSVAQTISYEVSMSLILLSVLTTILSFNFSYIISNLYSWSMFMMLPLFLTWFSTILAETNRTPFDFAEGESELVSGFNTEYSAGPFALIFMAEYMNIIIMSMITSIMFTGSSFIPLINMISMPLKTTIFSFIFVWARATLPRFRYDRLMNLTWKSFLPFSLSTLILFVPLSSSI
uniref:NADH-ubiquinone oxidoreductase chain 1 n=1 Tax=Laetmonice producta TaxID=2153329 RepID=A0A343W6E0_9ANNE|nr:NADH dehydrogenase subunit 1 [Laetmonice producta]